MLKKVIKYTGIQLGGQFISVFVTIFSTSILYTNLETREYGLISLLMGVFAIISFMKGSLSSAFAKFFAEFYSNKRKLNEVLSSSLLISFIISVLIYVVIYFFLVQLILTFLNIPVDLYSTAKKSFYLLIPFTLIQVVITPFRSYLNIKEDFYTITFCEILITMSKLLAAIVIIYENSIVIFFKFILFGQILVAIVTVIRFNMLYKDLNFSFSLKTTKSIWDFSKWIFLGTGLYVVKEQALGIVVNLLFGLNGNASYGIAKQIVDQINNVVNKLKIAMNPLILKNWNSKNISGSLAQNSAFSFLLVFGIIIFFTIFGDLILITWISEVPYNFYIFFYLLSLIVLIKTLSIGFYSLFQGFSKIKNYEIFVNITGIVPVLFFFIYRTDFFVFFLLVIVFEFISFFVQIFLSKRELNFDYNTYTINLIKNVFNPIRLVKAIILNPKN